MAEQPSLTHLLDDLERRVTGCTKNGYTNWYEISGFANVIQTIVGGYSVLDDVYFDHDILVLDDVVVAYVDVSRFHFHLSGPLGNMRCSLLTLAYGGVRHKRRLLRRYIRHGFRQLRAESNPDILRTRIAKIDNLLRECRDGRTLQNASSLFHDYAAWLMTHAPDDVDAMRELLRVQAALTSRMRSHPTPVFMDAYRALEQQYDANRRRSIVN